MCSRVVNLLCFYGFTTALAVGYLLIWTAYLVNDVGQLFPQHHWQVSSVRSQSMFGNCTTFYLDIWSNIGVQVRKLFEPSRYPNAAVLPVFDQYFGHERHYGREGHGSVTRWHRGERVLQKEAWQSWLGQPYAVPAGTALGRHFPNTVREDRQSRWIG